MGDNEAIKLAGNLAEPFDAKSFGAMSGQPEQDAANTLAQLQSMSWLEAEYSPQLSGTVYRLAPNTRQALASGSFG